MRCVELIVLLCVCSAEELNRYLNEEEGPVLVEQYVTKMDVVST